MAIVRRIQRRRRGRRNRQGPLPRVIRDRQNPLDIFSPQQVWSRYRFRPQTVLILTAMLSQFLEHPTENSKALPPLLQVCLTIRYLATGTFAIVVGDTVPLVSPPTAWRAINRGVRAILAVLGGERKYIRFPDPNDDQALRSLKQGFFRIAGFPNVIGAVDGTHVRIEPPSEVRHDYINRKGYPSLNCQMVCDHRRRFLDVMVKYPGSTHDSRMWRESALGRSFEANRWPHCIMLGDSAYYQRTFMMTPYQDPATDAEIQYNTNHAVTRCLIEQTFGIVKRRFALMKTGTRVRSMAKAAREILACCLLHNFGIDEGDLMPDDEDFDEDRPESDLLFFYEGRNTSAALGKALRDELAMSMFNDRHREN